MPCDKWPWESFLPIRVPSAMCSEMASLSQISEFSYGLCGDVFLKSQASSYFETDFFF